jgi:hypothetical protein
MWRTEDGKLFSSEMDAASHEHGVACKNMLTILVDRHGYNKMTQEDIVDMLTDNLPEFLQALQEGADYYD